MQSAGVRIRVVARLDIRCSSLFNAASGSMDAPVREDDVPDWLGPSSPATLPSLFSACFFSLSLFFLAAFSLSSSESEISMSSPSLSTCFTTSVTLPKHSCSDFTTRTHSQSSVSMVPERPAGPGCVLIVQGLPRMM
ncbi:hypothetical protein KC351_g105 [Hortaea werneckii]|nr:hypothetical protein KC351_g105 [Hortaea werneckii]